MASAPPVWADQTHEQGVRAYELDETGGVFDVPVHHEVLTTIYLPEAVEKVLCPNQKDFDVQAPTTRMVTIRARRKAVGEGNVHISGGSTKITLNLLPAEKHVAVRQINFSLRSARQLMEQEIEKRATEKAAELRKKEVRGFSEELAAALTRRFDVRALKAIARNDNHVIVRVEQVAQFGLDSVVFFEIQNRGDKPYKLAGVLLEHKGAPYSGEFRLDNDSRAVEPDKKRRGVLVVRPPASASLESSTLIVRGDAGSAGVRVTGIVFP